jgi:hypothetical protein
MNNRKAETCKMMRNDQGNIKAIIPGNGKCSKCPARIQPRLNHPEILCPFRPKGLVSRKTIEICPLPAVRITLLLLIIKLPLKTPLFIINC